LLSANDFRDKPHGWGKKVIYNLQGRVCGEGSSEMEELVSSKRRPSKTIVNGRSEPVELCEKEKGFFVIDIPEQARGDGSAPRAGEPSSIQETGEVSLERLKEIFDLLDSELLKEHVKGSRDVELELKSLSPNNRRSEMEILAIILKSARQGATKTRILYEANLSGRQLKNYLSFLMSVGCITERSLPKRGSLYQTTPKGGLFLSYWAKLISLLESQDA